MNNGNTGHLNVRIMVHHFDVPLKGQSFTEAFDKTYLT